MLLNTEVALGEEVTLNESECTQDNDILIQTLCNEEGIDYDQLVNLSEQKTIVRFNKQAKIKVLQGRAASLIAKEKKDPKFAKMMFYRRKYIELKRAIQSKYQNLAIRRAVLAFKTGNLVEPTSSRSV